jgi:hypothetical protein
MSGKKPSFTFLSIIKNWPTEDGETYVLNVQMTASTHSIASSIMLTDEESSVLDSLVEKAILQFQQSLKESL